MVTALALVLATLSGEAPVPTTEWKLEWSGRKDFGQCTRVFAMEDRLVFFDSPPVTTQDGGDVWIWRDRELRPQRMYSMQEKGVSVIRRFGGQLAIPGPAAMEFREFGNWYVSGDKAETWSQVSNLPKATKVFDLAMWNGRLYAGVSDSQGSVLVSDNGGKTWGKSFGMAAENGGGQVRSLVPLSDALYANWSPSKPGEAQADFYRYDGKAWSPLKLFPEGPAALSQTRVFDNTAFLLRAPQSYVLKSGKATPIESTKGLEVFDVEQLDKYTLLWAARDLQTKQSALYRSTFMGNTGEVGELKILTNLPPYHNARTLAIHNGKIFVGCDTDSRSALLSLSSNRLRSVTLN